jgi:hypothetical protein
MSWHLLGKVSIVTGGTKGTGPAIVEKLLSFKVEVFGWPETVLFFF